MLTDEEKISILKECFTDTIWMAARYAHGRSTYAPSDVRRAVINFQKIFPEWRPKQDHVIQPRDIHSGEKPFGLKGDYLDDIFNNKK